MVGARKKKKASTAMPQFKVGAIYHSTLYSDFDRNGHYVVVAEIISPTQIRVHVCTSSERLALRGAIHAYGLLGPSDTYILTKADMVHPSMLGQSRHLTVPKDIADMLGIRL